MTWRSDGYLEFEWKDVSVLGSGYLLVLDGFMSSFLIIPPALKLSRMKADGAYLFLYTQGMYASPS